MVLDALVLCVSKPKRLTLIHLFIRYSSRCSECKLTGPFEEGSDRMGFLASQENHLETEKPRLMSHHPLDNSAIDPKWCHKGEAR